MGCLMVKLSDLGFQKQVIVETIVSTYNANEDSNAAPMGVTMIDEEHLFIDFFNSSSTLGNVKSKRSIVVNLTGAIDVFYRAAFKEANPDGKLPQEWFRKADLVNAPKLAEAEATIEASIYNLEVLNKEKNRASFKVRCCEALKRYPVVYCRAFGVTLEAIILATRVEVLENEPQEQERVKALLSKIKDCDSVVSRVAPNSSYSVVMADLQKRISFR